MPVIANATLLVRRIGEAHRRRLALRDRRERASRVLPDWTILPLRQAGLSAAEIERAVQEQSCAEQLAGIDAIDRELEQVDAEIDRIEGQLLTSPAFGIDGVATLLRLALDRLRENTVVDPASVFYDYGDARTLSLLERAALDLEGFLGDMQRQAG